MRMKLYARHFTKPFHAIWLLSVVGFLTLTRIVKVVIPIFLFNHTVDTLKNIYFTHPCLFFNKGRPVGSTPEHTYVCEYRVDRAARLFTKVARARHQVCTKPYAFETFPQRIKHYRTYLVSIELLLMKKVVRMDTTIFCKLCTASQSRRNPSWW